MASPQWRPRFWRLIGLLLIGMRAASVSAQSIYTVTAPASDGTSTSLRAPNGLMEHAYHRTATFIRSSELPLIPSGMKIPKLGFLIVEGAGARVEGNLTIYMANSVNASADLKIDWGETVSTMSVVYDGPFTIPDSSGALDLELTNPFTYTGGGLYVAYDFESRGPFTTKNAVYAANTALLASARSGFSSTSPPSALTELSDFRPVLRFGFPIPPVLWSAVASGSLHDLWSLDVVDDSTAWVCSTTGGVFRTTDRGVTWGVVGTFSSSTRAIVGFTKKAAVVVVDSDSGSGKIFKTTNDGVGWTEIYDAGPATTIDVLDNPSSWELWGVTGPINDTLRVVTSFDRGETWEEAASPIAVPAGLKVSRGAFCRLGSTLWFGTGGPAGVGGRVYKSESGPDGPWSFSHAGRTDVSAIAFSSPDGAGLAAHTGCVDTLIRTTDGGGSWQAHAVPGLGEIHSLEYFPDGTDAWAATSTGVWHTTDDGKTWERSFSSLTSNDTLRCVRFFRNCQAALAVGSRGVIVRGTWFVQPVEVHAVGDQLPTTFLLKQNYPNPFNPRTSFEFTVPSSKLVSIRVFDVLGRELATLVNGLRQPGVYRVDWNASGLPSGVYFYRLAVDGAGVQTKKMTLLK